MNLFEMKRSSKIIKIEKESNVSRKADTNSVGSLNSFQEDLRKVEWRRDGGDGAAL